MKQFLCQFFRKFLKFLPGCLVNFGEVNMKFAIFFVCATAIIMAALGDEKYRQEDQHNAEQHNEKQHSNSRVSSCNYLEIQKVTASYLQIWKREPRGAWRKIFRGNLFLLRFVIQFSAKLVY